MIEKQESISKAHLATGRAVDQLRRQLGIVIEQDNGLSLGACPVEGLTPELLETLRALPQAQLYVLLTDARARGLGFEITDAKAVSFAAQNLTLPTILALADPLVDTAIPRLNALAGTPAQEMLLSLVKYASLLPALLIVESAIFPDD